MKVEEALKKAKAGELKRAVECDDGRWVCKYGHVLGPKPPKGKSNGEWYWHRDYHRAKAVAATAALLTYRTDPQKYNKRAAIWRQSNPDRVRDRDRRYREQNRDRRRGRCAAEYDEQVAAYGRSLSNVDASIRRSEMNATLRRWVDRLSPLEVLSQYIASWGPTRSGRLQELLKTRILVDLKHAHPRTTRSQLAIRFWALHTKPCAARRTNHWVKYDLTLAQRAQYEAVKAGTFRYKKGYGWWDAGKEGEKP